MVYQFKIVVEKTPDGYVAYPLEKGRAFSRGGQEASIGG